MITIKRIIGVFIVLSIILSSCSSSKNDKSLIRNQCSDFSDETDKELCLIRDAVKNNQNIICDELKSQSRSMCYLHLAFWYNNPNYCEKINLRNDIEVCWFGIATQTNNLTYCDNLRNIEGLPYQKDVCVKVASISNTKSKSRDISSLDGDSIFAPEIISTVEQDKVMIKEFSKLSGDIESKDINKIESSSNCEILFSNPKDIKIDLDNEFENDYYSYNIPSQFRDEKEFLGDSFLGDSYFSAEAWEQDILDDIVLVKLWSFTETEDKKLDEAKDSWIEGIYENPDRVFEDVPDRVECKSRTATGEEAYLVKTNFYRKSNGWGQTRYDIITLKDKKSILITISVQHGGNFTIIEQQLDHNLFASSILNSLYIK